MTNKINPWDDPSSFGYGKTPSIIEECSPSTYPDFKTITLPKLEYDHLKATEKAYEDLKQTIFLEDNPYWDWKKEYHRLNQAYQELILFNPKEAKLIHQRHENYRCICGCNKLLIKEDALKIFINGFIDTKGLLLTNVAAGLREMSHAKEYQVAKPIDFPSGNLSKPNFIFYTDTDTFLHRIGAANLQLSTGHSQEGFTPPSKSADPDSIIFKNTMDMINQVHKKCDCGATSCKLPKHSDWCSLSQK